MRKIFSYSFFMPKSPLKKALVTARDTWQACAQGCTCMAPKILIIIGVIILCTAIVLSVGRRAELRVLTLQEKYPDLHGSDLQSMGVREKAQKAAEMIRIITPAEGASISSPFTLSWQARGGWFSEGIFTVELRDNDGKNIGTFTAQATGEWMTEEFVPFTATLTFPPQKSGAPAKLVFKNWNPSGEPENALEHGMWVSFR